ncbi:serine threonine kinase [Chlorella sorokiniana]|uniref:non-specific serine/threonine protein kinase n=1 Tax=Chlorella sorokiniana TaxID=3076 RepID=A0A2P6TZY7_CHLSO|nr:serine threonine kinase [Chlorella sorokiniana]|eukprot:PRW59623.1 serine threonine kinase [Chlorella sorokiniana]
MQQLAAGGAFARTAAAQPARPRARRSSGLPRPVVTHGTPIPGHAAVQQPPGRIWRPRRKAPALRAMAGPGPEPLGAPAARGALPGQIDLPAGTLLGGKYEVVELLGRGGNGTTYRCRRTDGSGGDVAAKVLSLRSLRDWKQLELFEREAQILKNLSQPGIPQYLEYFEQDTEQDRAFVLVQELAQGKSLADLVASGWRADEAEVTRIALELLDILGYLGSRRPPVIHRDVKPDNIVLEGGRTGGRVYLVDFGGVQAAAATAADPLGSTIVGTYGYMAPEQFRGAASPASDLYGLGGTLLFLLTGRPPSAFPVDRMRIDFSSVKMGARLEAVLEGLLEPVPEDRMPAEEAAAILSGKPRPARAAQQGAAEPYYSSPETAINRRRPAGSKIVVKKRGPRLEIDIPPSGLTGDSVATGAFAIAWNSFVAFWTISAVAGGGLLFGLFSLPFWAAGWQLAKQAFGRQFIRERLVINLKSWAIEQQLAFARKGQAEWEEAAGQSKEVSGRAADLQGADIEVPMAVNGQPQYQLVLQEGINRHVFGEGLNPLEQEWLAAVINEHLDENRGRARELEGFVDGSPAALPERSTSSAAGRSQPTAAQPASSWREVVGLCLELLPPPSAAGSGGGGGSSLLGPAQLGGPPVGGSLGNHCPPLSLSLMSAGAKARLQRLQSAGLFLAGAASSKGGLWGALHGLVLARPVWQQVPAHAAIWWLKRWVQLRLGIAQR